MKKFNKQFPNHAIHIFEHFRYNSVPKTEVPKTRMDRSSTVRNPTHYSAHGLAENFILLNSRLHELSIESKNAQIGIRTGKLWSSKVSTADSQGWCGNSGITPFSIMPRFAKFRDVVLDLDGPRNSYTRFMTVPQPKIDYTMK